MTRYLLLDMRFLDGRYHGLTDEGEQPEWPPSPFRLFQALLAGNARGDHVPDKLAQALTWLETLPPPDIIAPAGQRGAALLTYVLNNVSDKQLNSRTPKYFRPTLLNGDRLVQYAWRFDDAQPEAMPCAQAIVAAAGHVRALGWGIDMTIGTGRIVEARPQASGERRHYSLGNTGSLELRTPCPGSLQSLRDQYADYRRRHEQPDVTRLERAYAMYRSVCYVSGETRPFVAFRLVDDDGSFTSISPRLIAPLVGMVRRLASDEDVAAEIGRDVIDRDILGHPREGSPQRVSILPLPTVRDGPTDGRIRRLLLAQAPSADGRLCRQLAELLNGRVLRPLADETRFDRPIHLEQVRNRDAVVYVYCRDARQWASVTPVLLPGFDDRRQHRGDQGKRLTRAGQLLLKALAQSGLPVPQEWHLTREPLFAGALHVRQYAPREKLVHYPRYHVRLRFPQPLAGPLAIGAGRHCGFGVLAACD